MLWAFNNTEEIIKAVKAGGSLGCSDHALVEFVILEPGKEKSQDPEVQESELLAV